MDAPIYCICFSYDLFGVNEDTKYDFGVGVVGSILYATKIFSMGEPTWPIYRQKYFVLRDS